MSLHAQLRSLLDDLHAGRDVRGSLARLDALVAERGRELDAHLRHYLENRSYGKARDWLAQEAGGEPSEG